jgi:hypothetical protein
MPMIETTEASFEHDELVGRRRDGPAKAMGDDDVAHSIVGK